MSTIRQVVPTPANTTTFGRSQGIARLVGPLTLPFCVVLWASPSLATDYHVDGSEYVAISDVPWQQVKGGDTVFIHWREQPYRETFGIEVSGTSWDTPVRVSGVPGANGVLPVLDGESADSGPGAHQRGVLSVRDGAQYVVVENLEVRGANQDNGFPKGASGIYAENGAHLLFSNLVLTDNDNGMFSTYYTEDVIVRGCTIYGNGVVDSIYEHNNYTESNGILFEFNTFGLLRDGAAGNNLKDRSAHSVIRYNWIDGGNRGLDLVEPEGGQSAFGNAAESEPHYVYGNVIIKRDDGTVNDQVVHFGGDNGTGYYRRVLHFYHNTVYSTRGGTTAFYINTEGAEVDIRNNVFYTSQNASSLRLFDSDTSGSASITFQNNFVISGNGGSAPSGLTETGTIGGEPMFRSEQEEDFYPAAGSPLLDAAIGLAGGASEHPVEFQFVSGGAPIPRADTVLDLGALEACDADCGVPAPATSDPSATSMPECTGECGASSGAPASSAPSDATSAPGPGGGNAGGNNGGGAGGGMTPGNNPPGTVPTSATPGVTSVPGETGGATPPGAPATSDGESASSDAATSAAKSESSCACALPGAKAPRSEGLAALGLFLMVTLFRGRRRR